MSKVLIADDSAVLRRIMMRVLREADPVFDEFVEAADGEQALASLEMHPDVDLVVCDLRMPHMDGLELLRAVRERCTRTELPVVLVASETDGPAAQRALADGANACIAKPFNVESIRELVAQGSIRAAFARA